MAGAGHAGSGIGMGVGQADADGMQGAAVAASAGRAEAGTGAGNAAEAVIMPRLDMTTEEMTILRWMKGEGEFVDKGDALLEVMTEKIAIEIDAPVSGYVRGIRYGVDEVVPVGEIIAYIAAEAAEATVAADTVAADTAGAGDPVPRAAFESGGLMDVPVGGSGAPAMVNSGTVRAAPIARRIAADLGVDLQQVVGSGPGGRVLADDVRSFAAAPQDDGAGSADGIVTVGTDWVGTDGAVTESRLTATRRAIARRMEMSWRTAPHVTLTIDVDMSEAAAFRDRLREALVAEGGDGGLTWTAMIAWVAVHALARRPELNATLEDDVLRRYDDIHLGVAVDTPSGLIVPVIPAAQRLGPAQLAAVIADAAAKAGEGRLQPGDVTGATFTITNLGGFGIGMFTPILNPPQVAILGVGAVREQVIPVDGLPAVRPVCSFSLSFDHRAADGADGARYLALLKELLLDPHRLIV